MPASRSSCRGRPRRGRAAGAAQHAGRRRSPPRAGLQSGSTGIGGQFAHLAFPLTVSEQAPFGARGIPPYASRCPASRARPPTPRRGHRPADRPRPRGPGDGLGAGQRPGWPPPRLRAARRQGRARLGDLAVRAGPDRPGRADHDRRLARARRRGHLSAVVGARARRRRPVRARPARGAGRAGARHHPGRAAGPLPAAIPPTGPGSRCWRWRRSSSLGRRPAAGRPPLRPPGARLAQRPTRGRGDRAARGRRRRRAAVVLCWSRSRCGRNPFAAALLVPALHLWLWAVDPDLRLRLPVRLVCSRRGWSRSRWSSSTTPRARLRPVQLVWGATLLFAGHAVSLARSWSGRLFGCVVTSLGVVLLAVRRPRAAACPSPSGVRSGTPGRGHWAGPTAIRPCGDDTSATRGRHH